MMKNRLLQAQQIFTILRELNPKPTTELIYSSAFELLVSVVLSAQATDVGVNKATARLFKVANTPEQILALGVMSLESYISTINFYRNKAKNVIGLCQQLIANHNSEVPEDFDALIALPGVGRKTANVILNTLFGHENIAVDTHVLRVGNRLGIAKGKTPDEVEVKLQKNVPGEFKRNAHHWLILHGRYICKARKPECEVCAIRDYCDYYIINAKKDMINKK
ncbi:MAG: nth [Burkholderiales bacterium]|jgi:endonuclease-3|nr:nth [Burkholderiales bacterium]